MNARPSGFDRLARVYRVLEFAAFGRDLERARFCLLEHLSGCRDILVLGEGDGRCLARLVGLAPQARFHCVDASGAMLALARHRLAAAGRAGPCVRFEHADAFSAALAPAHYDAVVTLFFLDCFSTEQVAALRDRIQASLKPGAAWLFADFAVPSQGWQRWRARAWLAVLYAFFRWQTNLAAWSLPDSERLLAEAGWRPEAIREFQGGLVRTVLFQREAVPGTAPGPVFGATPLSPLARSRNAS